MTFTEQVWQCIISGIAIGSVYALIALGMVLIFKVTKIVSFAQGEFVMLGSMIMASCVKGGLFFPLGFIVSILATTLIGSLVYMVAIRPAAFSLIAQITITIAVGILIRGSALLIWGKDSVTLPAFSKGGPLRLLGASVNVQSLWIFAITILILVSLYLFFRHTIQGKALMACADNQAVARLVGINPHTMALVAFGIAALIGAIGGIISTPVTRMGYSMGLPFTFKGFCAAVIGGMDSLMGGVFAGLALGVIESLAGGMLVSAYKDVFTFAIVAIIIFYQVFRISRLERGI